MSINKTYRLADRLNADQFIFAPGVFDALSAKVADQSGAQCLYMSGFAVVATLLGEPDIGLVSMQEIVERARQITHATDLPIIADGDNGYGDAHNVARLANAYEQACVECIQLEDQVIPKKCGHLDNGQVIPIAEAVLKIKAAVSSRNNKQFLVMARTDAIATDGLNEALARADAFLQAGADILFIEAPRSIEDMTTIRDRFPDTPLVANMVEEGKTPELKVEELRSLGFNIVLRPVSALLAITENLRASYTQLIANGQLEATHTRLKFNKFNDLIGLPEYLDKSYE